MHEIDLKYIQKFMLFSQLYKENLILFVYFFFFLFFLAPKSKIGIKKKINYQGWAENRYSIRFFLYRMRITYCINKENIVASSIKYFYLILEIRTV